MAGGAAAAESPAVRDIKDRIDRAHESCALPERHGGGGPGGSGLRCLGHGFAGGAAMAFFLDELCHALRGGRLAEPIR